MNKEPLGIIIPAAGMGRRMKSYGPKPLIKIGDSTVIQNQVGMLRSYLPSATIVLVCGFKADSLMNDTPLDLIKIENENHCTTNVVRSIGMGLRTLGMAQKVLLVYGDLVFNSHTISHLPVERSSLVVTDNSIGDDEVGCVINPKGQITNLMYDLPTKWGQIALFMGKELQLLKKFCWNDHNYSKFGFEAINHIINKGGKFYAIQDDKMKIIDIDNSKDIQKAHEILL